MSRLNRRGYSIVKTEYSNEELDQIREKLTATPFVVDDFGNGKNRSFKLYLESENKIYMPRFYGIDVFGEPKRNKLTDGETIFVKFNGDLREEQKPVFDIAYESLMTRGGGIISLKCGGGKTVLALRLLTEIKQKTIILVHKEFLMTQWLDRIRQFIPNAKIGKIQQKTIETDGCDIVLAMVQSIATKEYDTGVFDDFGLCIFDECHHLGAEVFSRCLPKVASKYMLGLSATPNRKDGLRCVFEWYIGNIVYKSREKKPDGLVEVQIVKYFDDNPRYSSIPLTFKKKPCVPKMITNVTNHIPRTHIIVDFIQQYNKENRCILILTDRRDHLQIIHEMLKLRDIDSGFYVGGMSAQQLRDAQEKNIILGTFSMASEGMDIPKLNTIILASPKSDIVQSVGRILRQKKESRTHHPLIIDIDDNFSSFVNQSRKRLAYYNKCKYKIYITDLNGNTKLYEKRKRKKKIEDVEECLLSD